MKDLSKHEMGLVSITVFILLIISWQLLSHTEACKLGIYREDSQLKSLWSHLHVTLTATSDFVQTKLCGSCLGPGVLELKFEIIRLKFSCQ